MNGQSLLYKTILKVFSANTQFFSEICEKKSLQAYYSGGIPTFAILRAVSYQLDQRDCLVARGSLNPIFFSIVQYPILPENALECTRSFFFVNKGTKTCITSNFLMGYMSMYTNNIVHFVCEVESWPECHLVRSARPNLERKLLDISEGPRSEWSVKP